MLARRAVLRLAPAMVGSLWMVGCATDAQLRDFLSSTIVRVFWQTIGTALQAGLVNEAGG
jgi:hypothetical protein